MPKISVMVPVYQAEDTLHRCVNSILQQTFSDFELILVDDGSRDRSGQICDEYAQKDRRVRVIHKENGGVGLARNAGLDAAAAEYVTYVDSDDYLHPDMLQRLMAAVAQTGVKLCACGWRWTSGEALADPSETIPAVFSPEEFQDRQGMLSVVPWGKLYHRSCFDGIRYPPVRWADDEYVTYRILYQCDRICMVDEIYYAHFENFSSLTHSDWSPRFLDLLPANAQQTAFYKDRGNLSRYAGCLRGRALFIVDQLQRIDASRNPRQFSREKKLLRRDLKNTLRRHRKETLFSPGENRTFFAILHEKTYRLLKTLSRFLKRG